MRDRCGSQMAGTTPGVWCTENAGHDRCDPAGIPHRSPDGRRRWRNSGEVLPRAGTHAEHVATAAVAVAATAIVCDVPVEDLLGRSRVRHLAQARHVATAVIRSETPLSLPQIADLIGRDDHTTILHSVRRVDTDPVLRARADQVRAVMAESTAVDDPVDR